jgi:hypothetical protein
MQQNFFFIKKTVFFKAHLHSLVYNRRRILELISKVKNTLEFKIKLSSSKEL